MQMFFSRLTFLMCNVDHRDKVNFILMWKMGTKYHFSFGAATAVLEVGVC